ncbi:MAG: SHOCT domain-containing protein [Phycisphaerales bacterium]|nr:SHOCT domain-containing protein [Phycisphaerales bacterium]
MIHFIANLTLAQTTAEKSPMRLLLVVGLLMAAVLTLGLVIMALRKRLLDKNAVNTGAGSLLEDIRAMRSRAEISEEEYQAMRQRIIRKMSPSSGAGLSAGGDSSHPPINSAREIGRSTGGPKPAENPQRAGGGDALPNAGDATRPGRNDGRASPGESGRSARADQ